MHIYNTGFTSTIHNLLTQYPILAVYKAHTIQYKKHMIHENTQYT